MIHLPGDAIADYYFHHSRAKLWVHDTHGPEVEMVIPVYFRNWDSMPEIEQRALAECRGHVLDIGAGAGSHTLALQEQGLQVTALDISPEAVEVMKDRGAAHAIAADIFEYNAATYDTLLLLMNGIGLVGTVEGLRRFLAHAKTLLNPNGQLLFDSSDVAYLCEGKLPTDGPYYGEVRCRYEYRQQKTDWFTWLYIDKDTLTQIATEEGWSTELLQEDDDDQYLVRLTLA